MTPVLVDFDNDEVWGSYLSTGLVNREILIREEGEGNRVGLFVDAHFKGRISSTDAY